MSRARRNGAKVPNSPQTDETDASVLAATVVASRRADRVSLAGRPDNRHLPLVPEGLCHAVDLGAHHTACGVPVAELSVFPGLSYADAAFLLRCGECSMSVARTR